jgi:ketosteroid isomerase-like protein
MVVSLLGALLGCQKTTSPGVGPRLADSDNLADLSRGALTRSLEREILDGYNGEDVLELAGRVTDPRVGGARIGVGPSDVWVGQQLRMAGPRWPVSDELELAPWAESMNLRVNLSEDRLTAWVSDVISWRVEVCGKIAAIPLRMTALYARDGEEWSVVTEHFSYGATSEQWKLGASSMPVVARETDPRIAASIDQLLAALLTPARPAEFMVSRQALAIGPQAGTELRGDAIVAAPLLALPITVDAARLGFLVSREGDASVAYWVGTVMARPEGKPQRLRATLGFERGPDQSWMLAQAHVSAPISDEDLFRSVFGDLMVSADPLRMDCSRLGR